MRDGKRSLPSCVWSMLILDPEGPQSREVTAMVGSGKDLTLNEAGSLVAADGGEELGEEELDVVHFFEIS